MSSKTSPEAPIVLGIPTATDFGNSEIRPHISQNAFTDQHGRYLTLRGFNVSGDAKLPVDNPIANSEAFWNVDKLTYTGRPFKTIKEAEEWWKRLRQWGVGLIRWIVTWEAIEPREM
jgi:hypothetical protein